MWILFFKNFNIHLPAIVTLQFHGRLPLRKARGRWKYERILSSFPQFVTTLVNLKKEIKRFATVMRHIAAKISRQKLSFYCFPLNSERSLSLVCWNKFSPMVKILYVSLSFGPSEICGIRETNTSKKSIFSVLQKTQKTWHSAKKFVRIPNEANKKTHNSKLYENSCT